MSFQICLTSFHYAEHAEDIFKNHFCPFGHHLLSMYGQKQLFKILSLVFCRRKNLTLSHLHHPVFSNARWWCLPREYQIRYFEEFFLSVWTPFTFIEWTKMVLQNIIFCVLPRKEFNIAPSPSCIFDCQMMMPAQGNEDFFNALLDGCDSVSGSSVWSPSPSDSGISEDPHSDHIDSPPPITSPRGALRRHISDATQSRHKLPIWIQWVSNINEANLPGDKR